MIITFIFITFIGYKALGRYVSNLILLFMSYFAKNKQIQGRQSLKKGNNFDDSEGLLGGDM